MQPPTLARLRPPKPPPKPLMAGLFLLGVLAVGALILVPRLLDGTRQGQVIASQLAEATGQRVRIEGPVEVSLWPRPHIAITNLKLIALTGNTTVLAAKRVDINVTLASLLSSSFSVTDIQLVQPVITLTADQSGWKPNLAALSVDEIGIRNGILDIARTGQPERISAINGTLQLPSLTALVRADLKGEWRGAPINLALDLSPPLGNEGAFGYLKMDVGSAEATLSMIGNIDLTGQRSTNARLDVRAGQAASLWALFSSLGVVPVAPIDAGLRQPLLFSAQLAGSSNAYDLKEVNLKLGNWRAAGLARYVIGSNGGLSVALKSDVVDLSLWPTAVDWLQRGSLSVMPQWLGAFDLKLAGITLGSFKAAPVNLKGDISSGRVRVSDAVAMLPGDGRLQFSGTLATSPGAPVQVDGKLALESLKLRETLAGLGVEVPAALDDTALRQLKLAADVRGPWRAWGIPTLDATLDGIHITGQLAARAADGTFDTNFNVDQFDLDKYAQAQALPAWLWQLPPANVSVTFKQLRAGGRQAENVVLTAALAPDLLTIKSLDAADFGGNTVRLSGTLSPDATRDADLTLQLGTRDFAQLRQSFAPVARLLPEMLAANLNGPVDLSVRYRRANGETQQLSTAALGTGRIELVVTDKPDQPTTFKIRLQNRETASVLAQLVPGALLRPDAVLGQLDFYAEGTQQPGGNWQLAALQGQIAGLTVTGGTLNVGLTPQLSLTGNLALASANIDLWRQTLNPASLSGRLAASLDVSAARLNIAGEQLTDVAGQVQLRAPATLAVSSLAGSWQGGKVVLNGEASLSAPLSLKGSLDIKEANVALNGGNRFGLAGVLDLSVRANAEGADWASLVRSLDGDGEFSMDSGTFTGLDFAALTEALQDRRSRNGNIDTLLARGGESALSSFGGDFVIEEGMARATNLRLRTPSASAEAKADLDLNALRLDSQSVVSLRELSGAPPFNLGISGPLDALAGHFDAAALAAHINPPAPAAVAKPEENKPDATKPDAAKPDAAKPSEATPTASASQTSPVTGDALAVLPPEEPVPPSLDQLTGSGDAGPVAIPLATPAELAAQSIPAATEDKPAATAPAAPAARPRQNLTRRSTASTTPAPAPRPAAAIPAPAPEAAEGTAPPTIEELLQAMPSLQTGAAAAVSEARSRPRPAESGATLNAPSPNITFTPAQPAPAAPANGVAPEFAGETITPVRSSATREVKADGLTIRLPAETDEADETPAASVTDLMGRIEGEP